MAAVDNAGNTQETLSDAITATEGVDGDANGDGKVNVGDVDFVIEAIGEEKTDDNAGADANGDGKINVGDVDYVIERII